VDLLDDDLEPLRLDDVLVLINQLVDASKRVLLLLGVQGRNANVIEELLDDLDLLGVLMTVVGLEQSALLLVHALKGLHTQPGALVVLDVGTDLADHSGVTVVVEVVVLDLELLADLHADVLTSLECLDILNTTNDKTGSHRKVEGVEGSLVLDDALVESKVERAKDLDRLAALGHGEKVEGLAHLSLEHHVGVDLVELEEVGLVRTLLNKVVHERLENDGIIDGIHLDVGESVPAGLTTTSDRTIHEIISDKEAGLEHLYSPGKSKSLVLDGGEVDTGDLSSSLSIEDDLDGAEVLATLARVIEHTTKTISQVGGKIRVLLSKLGDEAIDKAIVRGIKKLEFSGHLQKSRISFNEGLRRSWVTKWVKTEVVVLRFKICST